MWLAFLHPGVVGAGPQDTLALDLIQAPECINGLLRSAGTRLQHLQLVCGKPGEEWDGFWAAVAACTQLASLQLVFLVDMGQDIDQQVAKSRACPHRVLAALTLPTCSSLVVYFAGSQWQSPTFCGQHQATQWEAAPLQIRAFLGEALTMAGQLCLPKLAHVALYMEESGIEEDVAFHVGVPLAPEQGAQGVCNALGRLVAAGVLPALAQACLCQFSSLMGDACVCW